MGRPARARPGRRRTARPPRLRSRCRPAPERHSLRRSSSAHTIELRLPVIGKRANGPSGKKRSTATPWCARWWAKVQTIPVWPYRHSRTPIPSRLRVADCRPSHKASNGALARRPLESWMQTRAGARLKRFNFPGCLHHYARQGTDPRRQGRADGPVLDDVAKRPGTHGAMVVVDLDRRESLLTTMSRIGSAEVAMPAHAPIVSRNRMLPWATAVTRPSCGAARRRSIGTRSTTRTLRPTDPRAAASARPLMPPPRMITSKSSPHELVIAGPPVPRRCPTNVRSPVIWARATSNLSGRPRSHGRQMMAWRLQNLHCAWGCSNRLVAICAPARQQIAW